MQGAHLHIIKRDQAQGLSDQAHVQQMQVRYPNARQKKFGNRPSDGLELYEGLGSGFLEWNRRFKRQISFDQFALSEDVKVDLFGLYLFGTAVRYYNRQVDMWWGQSPTLQYIIEKTLETFKTSITPAQAMRLFTQKKD